MKQQNKYILVFRQTRLQELVARFNTWPQAKFYLEHNSIDAEDYLQEHDLYQRVLRDAEQILRNLGRFQLLERSFLPSYRFESTDIVVVIGQDGLVANSLKYLNGQPVIAINPDPGRWDGLLLPFSIDDLEEIAEQVEKGKTNTTSITFAEAVTNDGQRLLAVNDLFIGPKSHISARYKLAWKGREEIQSSSGVIVSTGFGSTGWFQSILAGAMGVCGATGHTMQKGFGWSENRLQYTVREPFPSMTTGVDLVFGDITPNTPLVMESLMPEKGVIFSDGMEEDYVSFNSGSLVSIGVSPIQGQLVKR